MGCFVFVAVSEVTEGLDRALPLQLVGEIGDELFVN